MDRVPCPRGETLTRPSEASGAVATNQTGCAVIHEAKASSMLSKTLAMLPGYRDGQRPGGAAGAHHRRSAVTADSASPIAQSTQRQQASSGRRETATPIKPGQVRLVIDVQPLDPRRTGLVRRRADQPLPQPVPPLDRKSTRLN